MITSSLRNVAEAIIDPIVPALLNERIWAAEIDNPFAYFFQGMSAGGELHELGKIITELPQQNLSYAFGAVALVANIKNIKEARIEPLRIGHLALNPRIPIGLYLSKGVDFIFETIHLGSMYGDYVSGKKLQASVRLITWTYLKLPLKLIPKVIQKIVSTAFKIAFCIRISVFIYRKPLVATALVALFIAWAALGHAMVKDPDGRIMMLKSNKELVHFLDNPWENTKKAILG